MTNKDRKNKVIKDMVTRGQKDRMIKRQRNTKTKEQGRQREQKTK